MPLDPEKPEQQTRDNPTSTETKESEQSGNEEIGDFINRQVLERDSVFFEG